MIQLTKDQVDSYVGVLLKQPQDIEYMHDMLLIPNKVTNGGDVIYQEFYGDPDVYFLLEAEDE